MTLTPFEQELEKHLSDFAYEMHIFDDKYRDDEVDDYEKEVGRLYELYIEAITTLIEKEKRKAVKNALSKLRIPDGLLEAHATYNALAGYNSSFEYRGKPYASCHICGFSPEAMNDEIDRIIEESATQRQALRGIKK